jgi:hypothetical protein
MSIKEYKGNQLEFISHIERDGSGTKPINEKLIKIMQDENFIVLCLSTTAKTYIAHGFNSFVVKIK